MSCMAEYVAHRMTDTTFLAERQTAGHNRPVRCYSHMIQHKEPKTANNRYKYDNRKLTNEMARIF